jgi:hypothetical protein
MANDARRAQDLKKKQMQMNGDASKGKTQMEKKK